MRKSLKDIKKELLDNDTTIYYYNGIYVEIDRIGEYKYEYSIKIDIDDVPTRKYSISGLSLDRAVSYIYNTLK